MNIFKKKKLIVTHNGAFHADDLFACATLSIYFENRNEPFKIVRTRDAKIISSADIVLDVGGVYDPQRNRFDHHQKEGSGARMNGIPYASFGLIWKSFGMEVCSMDSEVWNKIDSEIVSPIDATDNGVDVYTPKFDRVAPYSGERTFLVYSPTWEESPSKYDDAFMEQVKKVAVLMRREIAVALADQKAKSVIMNAYNKAQDKRLVILDHDFPRYLFQGILSALTEPLYVVYPSAHSHAWKVEAVKKASSLESRKPFPESWRGILDNDKKFEEIFGLSDVMFSHKGGFLITTKTKESALAIAEKALVV